jgi:ubiquinone/menaquinone biosynthesis C-methylase UbiE
VQLAITKRKTALSTPIPPDNLMFLVSGHADKENWGQSREASITEGILPYLLQAKIELARGSHILDFGCGCGRILAGWENHLPRDAKLSGVDISSDSVSFCRDNIRFANVSQCGFYPPLKFDDHSIDFAYAASVWTHLTLPAAVQWAGEFARIIKPGGVAMISYHGAHYMSVLASLVGKNSAQLEERGYFFHLHKAANETFHGSNEYSTWMTAEFIRSLFKGFETAGLFPGLSHGPTHFAAHQDVVVLRRLPD